MNIYKPHEGFQDNFVRTNVDVVVGGGNLNAGKMQPYDAEIVTPFGIRKMGDLKVGDIISGKNGVMQKVIQIFEHGQKTNYEISFKDGRTVECGLEHLWKIRVSNSSPKRYLLRGENYEDLWSIWDTKMIIDFLEKGQPKSLYTPNCEPVQFTRGNWVQGNTIPPYVLGALLGDGCLSSKICYIGFTTADKEILEKLESYGYIIQKVNSKTNPYDYIVKGNDIRKRIQQKRLLGKLSDTKFIPEVYKFSPIEARVELMQGLFDTDGYIDQYGRIEYVTVSKQLCKDVCFLVRSMGGNATVTTKIGSYKDKNGVRIMCKKAYRIYIMIKDSGKYFYLPRKKERGGVDRKIGNPEGELESKIVSVKKLKAKKKMRCITVSNPDSLYITNDFVVTHNTVGACLSVAEWSSIPEFRAVFLRRNLGDISAGGGMIDEFKSIYGRGIHLTTSKIPKAVFPSGAEVEFMHVANENPKKLEDSWKGRQYDMIYMDEGTSYQWSTFTYLFTRNRGKAGIGSKIRITTNPEKNHWLRILIDWYVGPDGLIIPERSGVVRYMYLNGDSPSDIVMCGSKKEVYDICRVAIDKKLIALNKTAKNEESRFTYENLIKSFTFYLGSMAGNTTSISGNKDYAGSVAFSGERESSKLQEGNWNISSLNENTAVTVEDMRNMFSNPPAINNDKWITCDLADVGKDNTVVAVWNGFHLTRLVLKGKSTPSENASLIKSIAIEEDIADTHIIYDAIKAAYMLDYIPNAIPNNSLSRPTGLYARQYMDAKTELYKRLVFMIKQGLLTVAPEVKNMLYTHSTAKFKKTVEIEIYDEGGVIEFVEGNNGKVRLMTKKEMNARLGDKRSMDIMDTLSLRMKPIVGCEHYDELRAGIQTEAEMFEEYYSDDDYAFGTT